MKKFLSILLAVMMVLSTVSFAVPSAIGAMDSAADVVEAPVADLAEEAVLSEVDTTSFGKKVLAVNIDDYATFAQYEPVANASILDPTIAPNAMWVESGAAPTLNTEAAGKYITVTKGNGVSAVALRCDIWNTEKKLVTADGVYTFKWDMRAASAFTDANYNMVRVTNNNIVPDGAKDGSGVETYITPTQNEAFIGDGQWHTYTATVNSADMWIGSFRIYVNNPGAVDYKNLEVYYKPATANVTVKDGDKVVGTNTVFTTGATVAEITADIKVPGKIITGVVIGGKAYDADDTIVLAGDTEATLVTEKDIWTDATYGTLLVNVDFEGTIADGEMTYWDEITKLGATINPAINKPYQIKTNFSSASVNGSASPFTIANFVKTEGENTYFETPLVSDWTQFMFGRNLGTSWGAILDDATTAIDKNGIYTFVVDIKTSDTTLIGAGDNFRIDGNVRADGTVTIASNEKNEWATHIFVLDTTTGTAHKDNNGASVAGHDVWLAGPSLNTADASGTIAWDNARLYIKAPYADVTFYPGTNAAVEETTIEVSTGGFKLSELAIDTSMTSKVLVGAKDDDGNEYGMADTIFVGGDAAFTLLWEEPTAESAYGDIALEVDFNSLDTATTVRWPGLDVVGGTNYLFGTTDTADVYFNQSGYYASEHISADNIGVGPDGSKSIKHVRTSNSWEPNFAIYDGNPGGGNYEMLLEPGVYTVTYDVKASNAPYTVKTRVASDANDKSTMDVDTKIETTDWEHKIVTFDATKTAGLCKLYFFYQTKKDASTTVELDNIKVYTKKATANVTIDVDGTEYVWENAPTTGVTVDDIVAGAGVPVENPYESVNGFTFDGVTYTGAQKFSFVKDVKVKATIGKSETLRQDIGKLGLHADFNGLAEGQTGWPDFDVVGGTYSITLPDSVHVYYNVSAAVNDEKVAASNITTNDLDGSVAFKSSKTGAGWEPSISLYDGDGNGGTYEQIFTTPGYYTLAIDVKVSNAEGAQVKFRFHETNGVTEDKDVNITGTSWRTYEASFEKTKTGLAIPQIYVNKAAGTEVSYDNLKVYYKPLTTTVSFVANGEVADTKENVAIEGTTVADLLAGVKVSGYTVTGMKYAGKTYAADATDALTFAQANETVYLTVEKLDTSIYKPVLVNTADVRLGYDGEVRDEDSRGMRFSATMKTAGDTVTEAGWIITTEAKLTEAEIDFNNAEALKAAFVRDNANLKKVEGLNIAANGTNKIYASENNVDTFAAVLTGIPAANYEDTIFARAFVVDNGVVEYTDSIYSGTYKDACQYVYDNVSGLSDEQMWALEDVIF